MPEITQEEDRYQLYERLLRLGDRVKLEQINTCPHCEKPYKVCMKNGSSRNRCGEWACKLAARSAQAQKDKDQKRIRYMVKSQGLSWKHDYRHQSYKNKREDIMFEGFEYA